jgi:anti-sigma factor RsiW
VSDDLDTATRAFAAADAFEREAAELRAELRRLPRRAPGWANGSDKRPRVSGALPRIAVEAALLIAAAVFAGVAGFGALLVVVVMAAAWLAVCALEWVAHREESAEADEPFEDESLLGALRPRVPDRSRVPS